MTTPTTPTATSTPTVTSSPTPLLEVRDLRTWFDTPRGTVHAVDGVSIALAKGRTLGIVGESGSGKTVFARSIMNLLPKQATVPAGGEIRFEGRTISGLGVREMRRLWGVELAMVFQDPMTSLNPVVKIGQQIVEGLREHFGVRGREARAMAIELLRSVGLPAPERRIDEYPHQLSGGMRQRVTLAIALSCGPKLLIADEPTTALDVTVQRQILDLIQRQQRDRHMALILVTHDLGVVANRTDEIAVMYAGQVVEQAPTATLFAETRHPYTEALLGSIPRLEQPSHTPLRAIPGRPPDLVDLPAGCRFAPRCRYAQDRCLTEAPDLIELTVAPTTTPTPTPATVTPTTARPTTATPTTATANGNGSSADATTEDVPPADPTPADATPVDATPVDAVPASHRYRCFFPVGTDAGREALANNIAAGRTAAGIRVTPEGELDVLDLPDPAPDATAAVHDAGAGTTGGDPSGPSDAPAPADEQVAG